MSATQHAPSSDADRTDRALGAFFGAAIGDAMGGPVENNHAARIAKMVGKVDRLLPYTVPCRIPQIGPGYAMREDPGAVTDDTFIRADFTRFFLAVPQPWTPAVMVEWLLANAKFDLWWPPAAEGLHRVQRGEVTAEEGGLTLLQGGGIGWWTAIGIMHAGDPQAAAADSRNLSRVWKAPLEQDLLAATQAGLAVAMQPGATVDSVVEAMLSVSGPLSRQLITRAVAAGRKAADLSELIATIYNTMLMSEHRDKDEPPRAVDGALPPIHPPLPYAEGRYKSSFFAEQVPIAIAAFVFGKGDPRVAIPAACMIGRDADSTATQVGAWCGALTGESGLPPEWVEPVNTVNLPDIDIRGLATELAALRP